MAPRRLRRRRGPGGGLDGGGADAWPRGPPRLSDGRQRDRRAARPRRGAPGARALLGLRGVRAGRARACRIARGGGEHGHVGGARHPRRLPVHRRHGGAVVRADAAADAGGRHPAGGGGRGELIARARDAAPAAAHAGAGAALLLLHLHRAPPRFGRPHHTRPPALRAPLAAVLRLPHGGPAVDGRGAAAFGLLRRLQPRRALVLRVGRARCPEHVAHGPRRCESRVRRAAAHVALLEWLSGARRVAPHPGAHVPLLSRALLAPGADRRRGQARAAMDDALLPALLSRQRGAAATVPLAQRVHHGGGERPLLLPGRQEGFRAHHGQHRAGCAAHRG
mmetsp:Transcript_3137/g.6130  ORF Transcript_3137/g.6130 Transcript_3137/m.6130 type:complete len:336 (-) Transcript_3137:534-1541(-)